MVIISLGEDLPKEVQRPSSKAKAPAVQLEEPKQGSKASQGLKAAEKAESESRPSKESKAETQPSASKRAGSVKKAKAKEPEAKETPSSKEPKPSKGSQGSKKKADKENKEVLQLGKLDGLQLEVRQARGEPADSTKQMRAALFELTTAFQAGNKAAAFQAMGQLAQNPQGIQSLQTLPGIDPATVRYLEQALGVMASATPGSLQSGLDALPAMMDYDAPISAINFPDEAERKIVAEDWKHISARSKALKKPTNKKTGSAPAAAPAKPPASKSKSFSLWGSKGAKDSKAASVITEKTEEEESERVMGAMDFNELVTMNAGIISANLSFIQVLLQLFEQLLAPAVNADEGGLDCACDVTALRLFREVPGQVLVKDFQTCLLASARALLPDAWDSKHESAWIAVWTCIADRLEQSLPLPSKYQKPVQNFVAGLSTDQRQKLGKRSFERLFREHEQVSNHFNQSWMRLAFIISKTLDMAVRLFHEPAQMFDELTQLGLKHIMFQADSQFFQPWVAALVAEIQLICQDEKVVDAMNFALCVIGSIIGQALEAGATPILKAIVTDDVKALKKALAATPRGQRAEAVLGRGYP